MRHGCRAEVRRLAVIAHREVEVKYAQQVNVRLIDRKLPPHHASQPRERSPHDALRLRDAEGHLLCEWGKWPRQEANP